MLDGDIPLMNTVVGLLKVASGHLEFQLKSGADYRIHTVMKPHVTEKHANITRPHPTHRPEPQSSGALAHAGD